MEKFIYTISYDIFNHKFGENIIDDIITNVCGKYFTNLESASKELKHIVDRTMASMNEEGIKTLDVQHYNVGGMTEGYDVKIDKMPEHHFCSSLNFRIIPLDCGD